MISGLNRNPIKFLNSPFKNRHKMLEITRIRTEKEAIIEGLKKRNIDATETLDKILAADLNWRNAKTELESIAAEQNQLAKVIGELFKQGKQEEANTAKTRTPIQTLALSWMWSGLMVIS